MQQILGYIRRAITEYGMIQNGDTIAVGVSGGKDSVALLVGLARVRSFIGIDFSLKAITLDNQFNGLPSDYSKIQQLCDEYGIPYLIRRTDIGSIVFDTRNETNPCSLCARMRRGLLHDTTKALGCNKIALGHHYDDAVETFFMSLIFEGRLSCFQPVTFLDRTGITQIRPLLYCGENLIRNTARRLELPVVENRCPADGNTKRQEIKELIYEMQGRYPGLKARAFGAMQRLPLPEWGPVEHRRRPLPEELEE